MQNNHQSSESIEKEHIEQIELKKKEETKGPKESGESNRSKKIAGERISMYHVKGQRYAFLLLGILCLALILSLFMGNKPKISSESAQHISPVINQSNTPTFFDQVHLEAVIGNPEGRGHAGNPTSHHEGLLDDPRCRCRQGIHPLEFAKTH